MSAVKDKNGTWKARFYTKNDKGGLFERTKRGFKTKAEALRYEVETKKNSTGNLDVLFKTFVNENYLPHAKSNVRLSTYYGKKYLIDKQIMPFFKNLTMSNVTPVHINKWQNETKDKGYKQTYLRSIRNQISAIFNFAVDIYDLKRNPCKRVKSMGKKNAEEMNFWTIEEFNRFIKSVQLPENKAIFNTLYLTGIRIGEAMAIKISDIDFENKTININQTFQIIQGKPHIGEPKTPKSKRIIPMTNYLSKVLKKHIKRFYKMPENTRIFPYTKSTLNKVFRKEIERSGVKRIRLHDLRHSFVSMCINLDVNIKVLSEILGHENITTTINTYGHLYPNKQKEITKKLDELIERGNYE